MTAISRRRAAFASVVVLTIAIVTSALALLLRNDGWTTSDTLLLVTFALTTPWVAIGFWNSAIGFALLAFDPHWLKRILPLAVPDEGAITTRTAIVMPVFNESPERVFAHLRVAAESLAQALPADTLSDHFELHLLSDTSDEVIAAVERAAAQGWDAHEHGLALHYRRRSDNTGYKAGNLREFCEADGERFDYLLVLDADSLMSGQAIARIVRTMQANPRLGILQTLAIGLPSGSAFARIFQFGMRHAMRPYTVGSAWWQADHGPYWGHNAILAMAPFIEHCKLPHIAGSGPLSGPVLSHDQLEAAMMRGAGYEVRVLPLEDGSFEENPPTLLEFIKRDLRWCQGNLQYLWLMRMPGIERLGRLQLLLAIMMYTSAPAWLAFLAVGMSRIGWPPELATAGGSVAGGSQLMLGLALFGTMLTMNLAPKLFGLADVLIDGARRRNWGGAPRVVATGLAEAMFSMLLGPVMAVTQTVFIAGLAFGRRVGWTTQTRDGHRVALDEAVRALWLPTALGLATLVLLAGEAPAVLPWAAPLLAAWLLCVPLACFSSEPALGAWLARVRGFATPEEHEPPPVLRLLQANGQQRSAARVAEIIA